MSHVLELRLIEVERRSDHHLLDTGVRIDADQRARRPVRQRLPDQRRVARSCRQRRRSQRLGDVAVAADRERHRPVQVSEPSLQAGRGHRGGGAGDVTGHRCEVEPDCRIGPVEGIDFTDPELRFVRPQRRLLRSRQSCERRIRHDHGLIERLVTRGQEAVGDVRARRWNRRVGHALDLHLRHDRVDPRRVVIDDEHAEIDAVRQHQGRGRNRDRHRHTRHHEHHGNRPQPEEVVVSVAGWRFDLSRSWRSTCFRDHWTVKVKVLVAVP